MGRVMTLERTELNMSPKRTVARPRSSVETTALTATVRAVELRSELSMMCPVVERLMIRDLPTTASGQASVST